jgi:general secretion pathway protein M
MNRAQLTDRWQALAPRERVLLVAGVSAVVLTLLFVAVWEPLANARHSALQQRDDARRTAERLEVIGAQVAAQGDRPAAPQGGGGSLLAVVDRAARAGTLNTSPSRIQPDGDRAVRIWLDEVAFDNLLRWLDELENQHGVGLVSLDLERADAPGRVNARLTVGRPA